VDDRVDDSVEACGWVWGAVDMRVLRVTKTARSLARMSGGDKIALQDQAVNP